MNLQSKAHLYPAKAYERLKKWLVHENKTLLRVTQETDEMILLQCDYGVSQQTDGRENKLEMKLSQQSDKEMGPPNGC